MLSSDSSYPIGTRSGAAGPVTCATCGCRLQPVGPTDAAAWFHFGALGGRDARGCRVSCADMAHDGTGHPVPPAEMA